MDRNLHRLFDGILLDVLVKIARRQTPLGSLAEKLHRNELELEQLLERLVSLDYAKKANHKWLATRRGREALKTCKRMGAV